MKILIADDNPTCRMILQAILTKWNYEVIITSNGEEAYSVFQQDDPPQLAVLDWEMPGINGADLCRKLRAQEQKKPLYLILLTGKDQRKDVIQGLEAGADDYISKPYNNEELRARISVGRRMVVLQNKMRERDKFQGILEMAGAVCHELNQPLQVVSGCSELVLMDLEIDDPNYKMLKRIHAGIERIGKLTRKIMNVTSYQSKPYLQSKIVDLDQASRSQKMV